MRFELTTLTLARLCSTPELRPLIQKITRGWPPREGATYRAKPLRLQERQS